MKERWFPQLKKSSDHVVCPKCHKQVLSSEMNFPYDTFWVPAKHQEQWCNDCISDAAEDQEQRKFENFHGG